MNIRFNSLFVAALAGVSAFFAGCQSGDEDKQHYDNKLFISASVFTQEMKFKAGDTNVQTSLSVAMAKPEEHDVKATLAPDPDLLNTYRLAYYDPEAVILPTEHYSIPEGTTTIQAGSTASSAVEINFLNTGDLEMDKTYVLPVTVESAEGIGVLQSAKNYYYVFKAASLVNVVCNISRNRAYPDFNNDSRFNNLTENTMEMLFKANSFPNQLNTLMGIEGHYLLRCGDAGVPSNQLQVASSSNFTNTNLQFESGQWYHLAVTFNRGTVEVYINGEKEAEGNVGRSAINLGAKHTNEEDGSRCFWIGYSYSSDRYLDGSISEVRIWNRVLTADEIAAPNHFYEVEPESEGLIAYWKFNEGAGSVIRDHSASGFDLTVENEPTWEPVSLP